MHRNHRKAIKKEGRKMNYTVQVNEVKGKEGNVRAYANIVLDEVFKITNIAIIENSEKGQLFVSMPRYRTKLVDENNRPVYQDYSDIEIIVMRVTR